MKTGPGPTDVTVAAAILAGGQAVRLDGARKATLLVGGRRIIDRQLQVLRPLADPVFVVSPHAWAADLGVAVVGDLIPGHGALGGIYTAIVSSPRPRTFVVASDMPFLSAALLRHMLTFDADLVIPRTERGYEPLCALYSAACAAPIRARLDRGELAAARLPDGVRAEVIGPETLARYDPRGSLFVNVNTPHDYARARQLAESVEKPWRDRIMDDHG